MKKKISIVLVILLVMAAALSVKAHAAESNQRVIDDQTGISITDITPREENEDETKDYKVSSYYPIEVKTAKEYGVQLLVKTFLVPEDTNPQALLEKNLTRRGVSYEVSDILFRELL